MNENNEQLEQINITIIGVIIFIFILFHSLYILYLTKGKITETNDVSNEDIVMQSLFNRIAALVVILVFLYMDIKTYQKSNDNNSNDFLNVLSTLLATVAIIIEIYLAYQNYIKLKEGDI